MSTAKELPENYDELTDILAGIRHEKSVPENPYPLIEELRNKNIRYSYQNFLTKGGMKNIEVEIDHLTGLPVAKATLIDGHLNENVEMFFREARITAGLEHPNIVPVYDIGFDDRDQPFFMMKLLTGDSLQTVLKELRKGNREYLDRYPINARLNIFLKICDAIRYAHSKSIVHLDIKPQNIQLGSFGEVYLCDWGLAKVVTNESTYTFFDTAIYNSSILSGEIKGTPGFMAPEQIKQTIGSKNETTDIFSLGALLFALLNLTSPFHGNHKTILRQTLKGRLTPWRSSLKIPYSLKAVCHKAMQVNQVERYQDVGQLITEINAYLNGFATAAQDAGFMSQLKLLVKRNKKVSVVLMIAIILLGYSGYMVKINEMEAVKSLQLLKQQQLETEQAYQMYGNERKILKSTSERLAESRALQEENIPIILEAANNYLKNKNFSKARRYFDILLKNNPSSQEIRLKLTKVCFHQQDYQRIVEVGEISSNKVAKAIFKVSTNQLQLLKENPPVDTVLLKLLSDLKKHPELISFTKTFIGNLPSIEYRESYISVLKVALEILNPAQKEVKITVERKNNLNYIDLSNNLKLTNIGPIRKIYNHSINLSNTAVSDVTLLGYKMKLFHLDLSKTPFKDLSQLSKNYPGLRRLTVSEGQFTAAQLSKLSKKIKVQYK